MEKVSPYNPDFIPNSPTVGISPHYGYDVYNQPAVVAGEPPRWQLSDGVRSSHYVYSNTVPIDPQPVIKQQMVQGKQPAQRFKLLEAHHYTIISAIDCCCFSTAIGVVALLFSYFSSLLIERRQLTVGWLLGVIALSINIVGVATGVTFTFLAFYFYIPWFLLGTNYIMPFFYLLIY